MPLCADVHFNPNVADVAANRPLKYVSPAILTIMNLSMVFIYLTGAQKTADGLMKISTLLLTIQYVNSLIPSLNVLPIVFNMVPGAGIGLARIGELMEYSETGIPDRPAAGPLRIFARIHLHLGMRDRRRKRLLKRGFDFLGRHGL